MDRASVRHRSSQIGYPCRISVRSTIRPPIGSVPFPLTDTSILNEDALENPKPLLTVNDSKHNTILQLRAYLGDLYSLWKQRIEKRKLFQDVTIEGFSYVLYLSKCTYNSESLHYIIHTKLGNLLQDSEGKSKVYLVEYNG
ncbi:unnamed protein product [Lactuca saligna]|uniref:Uncharacterized protein n=1 Tax=Lactuca saligna TaxID=75948 RepID=A0AA35ZNN9_LACSI|nr:unnamed protein product [Lactuca saligna]